MDLNCFEVLSDLGELLEERPMRTVLRVFRASLGVEDEEHCGTSVGLRAKHSAHALNHLPTSSAGSKDDPDIRLWDIDSLVENTGSSQSCETAVLE